MSKIYLEILINYYIPNFPCVLIFQELLCCVPCYVRIHTSQHFLASQINFHLSLNNSYKKEKKRYIGIIRLLQCYQLCSIIIPNKKISRIIITLNYYQVCYQTLFKKLYRNLFSNCKLANQSAFARLIYFLCFALCFGLLLLFFFK